VIGRQISHFYIIRALGSGGMGIVYEAQDTRLPRSVAIKLLTETLSQNVDAIRRLKREARLASSLNHPNICTILDVDEGDGQAFIAMELLHGRTLKARLAERPLSLGEILDIAEQVADALAVAHDQGIIHRDITPGNVFLTDGGLVKLLDFGLAKHFESLAEVGHSDDLTVTGTVTGTIHYMAPERLEVDGAVDYRCDLFSLGVILYQMATGARPFDIEPRHALLAAIRDQPHVPTERLAAGHPIELARVIDKLLAKRPDDRYQTARALRADLSSLRPSAPIVTPATESAGNGLTSVAVLPFEIVGTIEATTLTFRDGLVEDISSRLGGVPHLRVAPRISTRALGNRSLRELGAHLNVGTVLEGTIQRAEDRIRVIANLVTAADERAVLPPVRIDRRLGDLLDAQDEVARMVCDGLIPSFSCGPGRDVVRDPEAAHAYTRALHHWRTCFTGGWRPALEHLQYALGRDPTRGLPTPASRWPTPITSSASTVS
jgi:TolB-like protein/tRNA A-37 threonylcarbamoyl transferase component Bud32